MKGQLVGYRRVSTLIQNTERQLADIELDRVFEDKLSGKDTNRPALKEMLSFVRAGDHVVVHSMDRLGRNIDDLRNIVKSLTAKGVSVKFVKENLEFTLDKTNPFSELMLNLLASVAEFERAMIKERQKEGVQIAKQKGLYKGRKQEITEDQIAKIKKRVADGEAKSKIAKDMNISRDTLYRYLA